MKVDHDQKIILWDGHFLLSHRSFSLTGPHSQNSSEKESSLEGTDWYPEMVIPHQNSSCRTKNPSLNPSISHLYKWKTSVRLRFLWTLGCADLLHNSDTHFCYPKHKDHLLMFFMSSGVKVLANIPIQLQGTVLIACLIPPDGKQANSIRL